MKIKMRKRLSAAGLLEAVRTRFTRIPDRLSGRTMYPLSNCLMSALAMFSLKYRSLLQFDQAAGDEPALYHNLHSLFGVDQVPSDTYMRERLDGLLPQRLRRAFKACFSAVQRGKALNLFEFMDGYYLVSNDGTGFFHSDNVHCEHCCEKHHRNGRVSYYHQIMSTVLVHPDQSVVLPLALEPIIKQDGLNKNDCERNASKRLLTALRAMHPKLKMVILEDGLHSNAPHIELLKSLHFRYIIGAKPSDHQWLFEWVKASQCETATHERAGTHYEFRWLNNIPLNESNEALRVNFLECHEISPKGKQQVFSWVTDFVITRHNVFQLMQGGRARWKIENETFNTLKTQDYHFEHNFGHGYQHLSTVMAYLMMLAFLIDQIQQLCCPQFQAALKHCRMRRIRLWERLRGMFYTCTIDSWEALFMGIADPCIFHLSLTPDSS